MTKHFKRPLSILLAVLMIAGVFTAVPMTVNAAPSGGSGCLEFTADSDQSGTNWTWNASTKTLTLSGATFNDCVWLKVDSATIILTDGTENVMHGGVYGIYDHNNDRPNQSCWSNICVGTTINTSTQQKRQQQNFEANGDLTIKGSGKLTMSPTASDSYYQTFAVNCHSLTIGTGSDSPELDYTAQTSYFHSYAMQAYAGFTLNSGDVKISCLDFVDNDFEWWAAGVFVRSGNIDINGGTLTVDVRDIQPEIVLSGGQSIRSCEGLRTISSSSTITLNGGVVDLTVRGEADTQRGIDASGNVTVNAGTIKVNNTDNKVAVYAKETLTTGEFTTYTNCYRDGKYIYFTDNASQAVAVTLKSCTAVWKNWNGDKITENTFASGTAPVYPGETPAKAEDDENTYTFAGWTPALTAATADTEYTATFTAVSKGIKYDDDNYIKPTDKVQVSDNDEGADNFGLSLDSYLNMQILGIQLKSSIATEGGDDGIRFVTAVNSNLLKGSNIEDYGYIVVKAKEDTTVEKIYRNMDKLTYDKVGANNIFTCKGTSNTISGEFGQYASNTDYKYVTLSLTGTSGSTDTVAARFYVKTKDGNFHYASYVRGSGADDVFDGIAFNLANVTGMLE